MAGVIGFRRLPTTLVPAGAGHPLAQAVFDEECLSEPAKQVPVAAVRRDEAFPSGIVSDSGNGAVGADGTDVTLAVRPAVIAGVSAGFMAG